MTGTIDRREAGVLRNVAIPSRGGFVRADFLKPGMGRHLAPAVVFMHGGGFTGGCKEQFLAHAACLCLMNSAVCLTLDYGLAPGYPLPAAEEDCRAACNWLYHRRDELAIDPGRMVVVGGSAGACIAASAIMGEGAGFRPANAVFLNGIMDLHDFYARNPGEREAVAGYLGRLAPTEETLRRLSPLFTPPRSGLNALFLHGGKDHIVPPAQSRAMAEAIEAAGGQASVFVFPEAGHAWFNRHDQLFPVIQRISAFVDALPSKD